MVFMIVDYLLNTINHIRYLVASILRRSLGNTELFNAAESRLSVCFVCTIICNVNTCLVEV